LLHDGAHEASSTSFGNTSEEGTWQTANMKVNCIQSVSPEYGRYFNTSVIDFNDEFATGSDMLHPRIPARDVRDSASNASR